MDRNHYYKSRYGITEQDYNDILKYQHGNCAICDKPPKRRRLAVDHDHKTGKVRGLLCWFCNRGVGLLRDNIVSAKNLAAYLENPPFQLMVGQVMKIQAAQAPIPHKLQVFDAGSGGSVLDVLKNATINGNPVKSQKDS